MDREKEVLIDQLTKAIERERRLRAIVTRLWKRRANWLRRKTRVLTSLWPVANRPPQETVENAVQTRYQAAVDEDQDFLFVEVIANGPTAEFLEPPVYDGIRTPQGRATDNDQ